jgi:predicted membrane protein
MGYDERRPVTGQASLRVHLRGARPGFIGGALLIVFGTLMFIDNLGFLPVSVFDAFWPAVFMGLGAYGLFRPCSSTVTKIWSGAALFAGLMMLLDDFHVISFSGQTVWAIGLITIGVIMLRSRLSLGGLAERVNVGSNSSSRSLVGRLDEYAVFSSVKRRIETPNFEGGELSSVFGGIEIDLRSAGISTPGRIAVLEANAAFGAIELRIPEMWRLSLQGTAIFGAYEDKTIPPRPEPGMETPTLVIKGGTAFGAVIIRN